jgi:hypothetical protein
MLTPTGTFRKKLLLCQKRAKDTRFWHFSHVWHNGE